MWAWLTVAIAAEVTATTLLRATAGFTRIAPSLAVCGGYGAAFYGLSQALRHGMDLAIAYAIWTGLGLVIVALVGTVLFDDRIGRLQLLGMVVVLAGVAALQAGSMI